MWKQSTNYTIIDAGPTIVHMPKVDFRLEMDESWPFGQPDSPSNLNYDLNTQQITSASIIKLIECLTHHQVLLHKTLSHFWQVLGQWPLLRSCWTFLFIGYMYPTLRTNLPKTWKGLER